MGNSITARLGLDSADYRRDLQRVTRETGQAGDQMGSAFRRTGAGIRSAADAQRHMSGSSTQMAGDLINMATGASGACNELKILTHTLGLPLAGAVGLAVAVGIFENLHETIKKVEEANKEARAQIAKPFNSQIAAGPEATAKAVEGKTEAIEKLKETRGVKSDTASFLARVGHAVGGDKVIGMVTGDNRVLERAGRAHTQSLQLQKTLEKQRMDMLVQSAALIREETGAREEAIHGTAEELELVNLTYRTKHKLAQLDLEAPAGIRGALKERVEAEAEIEKKKIQRLNAEKRVEMSLEEGLTRAQIEGVRMEERAAFARLDAAQALVRVKKTGNADEQRAAENHRVAAEHEYKMAVRRGNELRAQWKLQKEIASMIVAPHEKQQADLEGQRRLLQEKLHHAKSDEKPQIEVDLAVNAAQQRALKQEIKEKFRGVANAEGDAAMGRGEAEQIRNMHGKLVRGVKAYNEDLKNPEMDPQKLAESRAQLTALWRSYLDITEARRRSAEYSKIETEIMQKSLQHNPVMAQALRTQLDYREKIRQATKDGNTELAKQLEKQMQLSLAAQAQALTLKRNAQTEYSLSELVAEGRGGTRSKARRAARFEKMARQRGMAGDQEGAQQHMKRANELKKGIGALNFEDRLTAAQMANALENAQVLKDIKTATEQFVIKNK